MIRKVILFVLMGLMAGCAYDASVPDPTNTVTAIQGDSIFNFRITRESAKVKDQLAYYWYFNGDVKRTIGGYSGRLIHGAFEAKSNETNGLLVKGAYEYGLKDGTWKSWYPNGNLKAVYYWKKGLLDGEFVLYTSDGRVIRKGKYNNHQLDGKVTSYHAGAESTQSYKRGVLVQPKELSINKESLKKDKGDKKGRFKRFFKKGEEEDSQKKDKKKEKLNKESRKAERKAARERRKLGKSKDSNQKGDDQKGG